MKFTPVRLAQSLLALLPVVDGQLIFAWDTGNVYVDTAYGRFQQGISMLSDSSEIPLAPADKLYFNKDTKQLLYNRLNVFAGGIQKVAVGSDAVALVGKWYLCFNDAVVTLPAVHNQNDTVKVSTVLNVDNVIVRPAAGDTVQSDSGFLLNVNNSSVELTWLDGRWVASLVVIPRLKAPLAIVDGLPVTGLDKVYYNTLNNKLYYWDGAWKSIADYLGRVSALLQRTYKAEYDIKLGKCTGLGVMYGSDSVQLTWTDPANVELETAVLAEWKQTVLMKKVGLYPSGPSDSQAEIVAVTSRALGNKNYYSNNPMHERPSDSTYYKLFSQTVAGAWNSLDANCYPLSEAMSWGMIQSFVRAGRGPELFPVGTVFEVEHPLYTHTDGSGLLFRVAGHDQVPSADESLTHSMCLELVDILFSAPYDAIESLYALTEDTTAQAGKNYYAYSDGAYTALVDGTDYDVGDPVPLASWYEKNLTNHSSSGSNNPVQNNMIQWLNSSGAAGSWFTKQTIWDTCSSTLSAKSGFCRYIDQEFLAVVKPAKLISTAISSEGGQITHTAQFWPLSRTQVDGTGTDNVQLAYYSGGGSKTKQLMSNGTNTNWFVRTIEGQNGTYVARAPGMYAGGADGAAGYSPACIIA